MYEPTRQLLTTQAQTGAGTADADSPGSLSAEAPAPAADKQLLTHSRLSCFRTCPRKHYLRFELGLMPAEPSLALRIGSAFHAGLEADDLGTDPELAISGRLEDPYDQAMVAAMLDGHRRRYADEPLVPVASEQQFRLPLVNPDTGRPTPVWDIAGVADRIVKLNDGRLALMEYKTTSRDFAPGADYWLRLHMDQQLSIYVLAARRLGYDVQTILYDVTRRPALRPYKATPDDKRKYTKEGVLYKGLRDVDETPEEYAGRIAEDIAFRPDHYFARIEIPRLEQDLDACMREVWQQQLAIRSAQLNGYWYRNPGACFSPFACEFLPVCNNTDIETNTPTGFVRSDTIHPELSEGE